ncbi:MAG: glycosyltransferase family 2 protein [Anaerolineae bacterium]
MAHVHGDRQVTVIDNQDENAPNVPELSIVIVCWNNKKYLEPCLESLYGAGLETTFDVVLIDNGSSDGTPAMVEEKFPQVQLIKNDGNVGLSRASNQGIKATQGRCVLLLNDDTIVNARSLDTMVRFMADHRDAGAVGGILLNPDGTLQAGYGDFSNLWQEFMIATRLGMLISPAYPNHGRDDQPRQVGWLGSACLLVRRAALEQIGLLAEDYFIYGDEADLQYRLQQCGWKVYYVPGVTTIHYGGRSLDRWRRRRMVYRGKMLFYRKNYGEPAALALRVMMGALSLGKLALWGLAWPLPGWRQRADREVKSNVDILRACWKLE